MVHLRRFRIIATCLICVVLLVLAVRAGAQIGTFRFQLQITACESFEELDGEKVISGDLMTHEALCGGDHTQSVLLDLSHDADLLDGGSRQFQLRGPPAWSS